MLGYVKFISIKKEEKKNEYGIEQKIERQLVSLGNTVQIF